MKDTIAMQHISNTQKTCGFTLLVAITAIAFVLPTQAVFATDPLRLQGNRELFVDNYLIDSLEGDASLVLGTPSNEGIVFNYDMPWEGRYSGYGVFMQVADNDFRYYYRGSPRLLPEPDVIEKQTCVAYSQDGINWERPNIGKFEIYGTTDNNVILMEGSESHNFAPFIDNRPGVPQSERFKAIAGERFDGLYAYSSPDGLNWTKMFDSQPVLQGDYLDSMNVAYWSEAEQQYVLYGRTWKDGWSGYRWIAKSTSPDMQNWTTLETVDIMHDGVAVPDQHYCHSGIQPYFRAPQISVSLPSILTYGRVLDDDEVDTLDIENGGRADARGGGGFMTMRGGLDFDRTFMEEFISPPIGPEEWIARCNFPVVGILQTSPTEMSIYVDVHSGQPTRAVRRYSMRLDGFASLNAPYDGGDMLTKPFTFEGDSLSLNFATSSYGEILLQFETPEGQVIDGFGFDQCKPIVGNYIDYKVKFQNSINLSGLADQPVRMRVRLKDADIYSLQFQQTPDPYFKQIFHSAFDSGEDDSTLVGQVIESGQVWMESVKAEVNDERGKGSLEMGDEYGQSGTLGAGTSQEGNYWLGNSIAIGQEISDGFMTLSFDLKRERTSGHDPNAEINVLLAGDDYEMALIWQGGSLNVGGNVIALSSGAWQKSLDMGISTGDVHVELFLDMEAQAGTLSYEEIGAANSGSVDLDPITSASLVFDTISLILRSMDETMGYDNIMLSVTADWPEPGDANGDGLIDDGDAATLAANWLQSGKTWADGDFNGDGTVDEIDVSILAANWQEGAIASIPEPNAIVLLLCGITSIAMIIEFRLTRKQ